MTATLPSETTSRTPSRPAPERTASRPSPFTGLVGGARKVAQLLATPLVPEDYLDLIDPLRTGAQLRGRVIAIEHETPDAASVTIKPGRSWRGHTPGQYIRIGLDIDGVRHWRAYSLTHDARRNDGLISITTKAIPDGVVSRHIVRGGLTPGALVHLDQATGDFTLPQTLPTKTLFLTAGSGITPVAGMLRNHLPQLADVVHVHCAPSEPDVIFKDELRGYAADGHLTLIERHDDTHGVLSLADLDDLVPDWRERDTWVCGPTGLLDAAEEHWEAHHLADRLTVERFRPTIIEAGEGGSVTFARSGTVVEADGATPLLDAGENAGVLMPSGCRMGICFGCVVTLRHGAVRDLRTGDLTVGDDGDDLQIQTCINAAAGPCALDL